VSAPVTIKGAPPTLEWVAVDRLQVDPAYQRATDGPHSRKIIFGMVKCWDWTLCQPLVVSRRVDGSLFILDGQHRHGGAVERADISHLPCVILSGVELAGEAETFVALNTRRQKLSQADIFNGMLAAGDPDAKSMATLLTQTGWRQTRHSNLESQKPGRLLCAPMLVKVAKSAGEASVRNALTALREAYPDRAVTNSATLLKALIGIYRDGDLNGCDPDQFIEMLGSVEPGDWEDYAREARRDSPVLSRIEAMGVAMVKAYRGFAAGEALAA
jgi:hypothetical protein